jgi:hypothetical protein
LDFMKLLRSFEEVIFEAISWLVFYPITVWRIAVRPLTTMAYSDAQQTDTDEGRYDDGKQADGALRIISPSQPTCAELVRRGVGDRQLK